MDCYLLSSRKKHLWKLCFFQQPMGSGPVTRHGSGGIFHPHFFLEKSSYPMYRFPAYSKVLIDLGAQSHDLLLQLPRSSCFHNGRAKPQCSSRCAPLKKNHKKPVRINLLYINDSAIYECCLKVGYRISPLCSLFIIYGVPNFGHPICNVPIATTQSEGESSILWNSFGPIFGRLPWNIMKASNPLQLGCRDGSIWANIINFPQFHFRNQHN